MNKKGLSAFVVTSIMILLAIVVTGIIFVTVNKIIENSSPDFKITKEICEEKTSCYYSKNENSTNLFLGRGCEWKGLISDNNVTLWRKFRTQEICKEKEVSVENYNNWSLEDCYDKYWNRDYHTNTTAYKNYMFCANVLSSSMSKFGLKIPEDLHLIKCEETEENKWKCGDYLIYRE